MTPLEVECLRRLVLWVKATKRVTDEHERMIIHLGMDPLVDSNEMLRRAEKNKRDVEMGLFCVANGLREERESNGVSR